MKCGGRDTPGSPCLGKEEGTVITLRAVLARTARKAGEGGRGFMELPGQRTLMKPTQWAPCPYNMATAGRPTVIPRTWRRLGALLSATRTVATWPFGCVALVSNRPSEVEAVVERPSSLTLAELIIWGSPTRSGNQARGRSSSAGQSSIRRLSFRARAKQRPPLRCLESFDRNSLGMRPGRE